MDYRGLDGQRGSRAGAGGGRFFTVVSRRPMEAVPAEGIWEADAERRRLTLPEILAVHAHERPDAPAFSFLPDGENVDGTLSFGELDRQARTIASHLATGAGRRAVLVYPSSAEFVVALLGCLYAGVVAVHAPLVVSATANSLSRAEVVAADSGASLVLSASGLPAGSIPKTSSGKIQRKACRTCFLSDSWPLTRRA